MSEGPQRSRIRFSLKSLFALVAVICLGLALIRAGRVDIAVGVVFPFAAGLIIGEMVRFPLSVWLAALVSPFVVAIPLMIIEVWHQDNPTILRAILSGFWLGVFLLVTGYAAIAGIAGSLISQRSLETWHRGRGRKQGFPKISD